MPPSIVQQVTVHRLAIPLRVGVEHSAARRDVADPVIVEVELGGGTSGFGETLARPYVSGETPESVVASIEKAFVPALLDFHPQSFPEALEFIEALPWGDAEGAPLAAARAGIELALLDVSLRHFDRTVEDVAQWMGLPGFGRPGSLRTIRYSGVVATVDVPTALRRLRLFYWGGLRHFKLKVGFEGDEALVRAVAAYLAAPLSRQKASLRVDANGAWTVDAAADWLVGLADVPLAGVEQPLPRGHEYSLADLRGGSDALLIHDESLITEDDGRKLIEAGVADVFNIRISKCGGLIPSLRLAALARRCGVQIQLGCMVGETSILSAAGLGFLEVCPDVRWAEGCFGPYLMRGDVVRRPLRFGYAGRLPKTNTASASVERGLLERWSIVPVRRFQL